MIKERACTVHKHPGGANMVLRYESEDAICPLCEALDGNDTTDGGKEAIVAAEAKQHQAETECKKYKTESDEHRIESAKQKKRADELENEIVGPLEVKLKKAQETLEASGYSDKDGLIVKLQEQLSESEKAFVDFEEEHTKTCTILDETRTTLEESEKEHLITLESLEAAKQDCEEKNALIQELKAANEAVTEDASAKTQ